MMDVMVKRKVSLQELLLGISLSLELLRIGSLRCAVYSFSHVCLLSFFLPLLFYF